MNDVRREELERASLADLEQLIDALDRPWAPGENDRLRARFHEARRDPRRKADLARAIERCLSDMPSEDLTWVIEQSSNKIRGIIAGWAVVLVRGIAAEVIGRMIPRNHHGRRRHGR